MADLQFERVTKRYGEHVPVIRDLNLSIRDHEFMVLVGPSGCGKSTALRMIAGLEEITEGDLYIGGRRVNDVPAKDRDIAMVFQNYALYPHMSVHENMAFSLRLKHMPKAEIERRVGKAADTLGLRDYLARKPRALSGGQRQRVALGRALVRNPQVYLLDEPLSNLDAKLRVQMRAEIARLHQSTGTSFIYVTHDQTEAMTMGDRIAVLDGGVIQQVGTPQELYATPNNLFVASFIGSPSMNFLSGRLRSDGSGVSVRLSFDGAEPIILSGALAARLTAKAQPGEVIVGVRPEHLRVVSAGEPGAIPGEVVVVEHLGNEQMLYLSVPGTLRTEAQAHTTGEEGAGLVRGAQLITRCDAATHVTAGARVGLALAPEHIHLFDPNTTQALSHDERADDQ